VLPMEIGASLVLRLSQPRLAIRIPWARQRVSSGSPTSILRFADGSLSRRTNDSGCGGVTVRDWFRRAGRFGDEEMVRCFWKALFDSWRTVLTEHCR
jgi:hypothetical protein